MANKQRLSVTEYVSGIKSGNRVVLSRAITLIESTLPSDRELAAELVEICLPLSGNSLRIGITGVPGVGKSTFIDAFGTYLTNEGKKLAVLAVDPSSSLSKGSILGDKTRMSRLSVDKNAFIRPSPSSGALGGVAVRTREIILLCEAAGFDHILVETVGVGQSETMVHSMVDFFLLLMLAGAGDELQGIKRGIMELCDALVINKADGDNLQKARLAAAEYKNALHLFPPTECGWIPKVEICSAIKDEGLETIYKTIRAYQLQTKLNGYFSQKRDRQLLSWMDELITNNFKSRLLSSQKISGLYANLQGKVLQKEIAPQKAADIILRDSFSHWS